MNAKHTLAPWTVVVRDDAGLCVWSVQSADLNAGDFVADVWESNDAILIAAAPDLLAALRALEAGFADGSIQFAKKRQADSDPYHPANILMCAAIAKAGKL